MPDTAARRIVHADLRAELPDLDAGADPRPVFLVAWWGETLLGYGEVPPRTPRADLARRVAGLVTPAVGERMAGAGFERVPQGPHTEIRAEHEAARALGRPLAALDGADRPPAARRATRDVSLAICTRDRPDALERCLRSLAASPEPPGEVVVVDNAPHRPSTREVVDRFPEVRYVAEPRPGLSVARNAALRSTRGDVLAFLDDDCEVHPRWLAFLRGAFADDRVMAVTGLVLPAELVTEAQVAFELAVGGLGLGARPARFDGRFLAATRRRGTPVWKIGAGANMAIRRAAFELVGDFDERLGAGASGCSEDSELWYRLLADGWTCGYEPRSVVFHHHRDDLPALDRQLHDYAEGHVAALFVQWARHHHAGNLWRAFVTLPTWFARLGARRSARRLAARVGLAQTGGVDTVTPQIRGYARGLAHLGLALERHEPRHKAARGPFLRRNPFGHPLTVGFFYREKMRAIHRTAPDLPAGSVLEVGGGRSGMARMLYPSAHVTTVDLEEEFGAAEANRGADVSFVVADATDLPFADASFDVVTFFDVLEHIPDDARAVSEALRVLRPGGFVLVTTPSDRWRFPYFRALAPVCPTDQDMIEEWGHVRRGYSLGDLVRLLGAAPVRTAGFINPLTALGHDLAWSKAPERVRRALCTLVAPLTWTGYLLQSARRPGTEIAASWRKPAA